MTDKLRQAAQQMLEAATDLTILTPREWQAVHGLKINALRAALAEQPAEQEQQQQEPVAWMRSNTKLLHKGYQMFSATRGGDWNIPVYTAPQPVIPPGWTTAYAAFKGAFDTPLARRRDSGEYAQDARRLLREFNDAMLAAPEAPQPAKPAEQEPVEIELPEYHPYGMGCGLEDRGITDRYEAMAYGWYEAIDRVKEELANFGPLYTAPQPATPPGYKLVPESYLSDVSDMVSWLQAWRRASLGVGKLAADASDAIDAMLAAANKENTND